VERSDESVEKEKEGLKSPKKTREDDKNHSKRSLAGQTSVNNYDLYWECRSPLTMIRNQLLNAFFFFS